MSAPLRLPEILEALIKEVLKSSGLAYPGRAELEEDLRGHFEDGLQAGMDADQLAARFGNPARAGREMASAYRALNRHRNGGNRGSRAPRRGSPRLGVLSALGPDIRFAFRAMRRAPGFTAMALATLALGVGSSTAMVSVLNAAMARSLPFPESARLVMGRGTTQGEVNPLATFPDYMDYRDNATSLHSLAAIGGGAGPYTVTGAGEPEQAFGTDITPNLFQVLGVPPALGSTFTIDEQPNGGGGEVVISYGFWERWFGSDPEVVGRSLTVEGAALTVRGVMPPGFRFLYDTDLWTPPWPGHSEAINRRYSNWLLVGRLADGVSLEEARSEAEVIATQLQEAYPNTNSERSLQLDPLHSVLVEGARQSLLVLTGAIVLLLLIACANVATLLLAKGTTRTSELAVRTALGAGPSRLTRHLLVECTILALGSGVLGIILAVWLQETILGFISLDLLGLRRIGISWQMLGTGLALSMGTVLLFGVFPSFSAAMASPARALGGSSRGSTPGRGIRVRSGMVVLQVALSLMLLVASGLLIKSFSRLRGVEPGYRVENLLTASIHLPDEGYEEGEQQLRFFEELRERVGELPGVEGVALINRLPVLHVWGNYPFWAPERPPEGSARTADRRVVLPGYFATMEIPVVEGRVFDQGDVEGSPQVIILNESAARVAYPDEGAVGRQVMADFGRKGIGQFEIVGVVKDHRHTSLAEEVTRPAMFLPMAQFPLDGMSLAVATSVSPYSLVRPVQERLWELDRDLALADPQSMAEALADSISDSRSIAVILSLFAWVAMALAVLGLYGVLAFFVNQRVHEIGVRVALGASVSEVLGLVIRRGLLLVSGGLLAGIGGALLATRLIEGMLFQISATHPGTYGTVAGTFTLVALAACLVPAWRALRVDPVEAFRSG